MTSAAGTGQVLRVVAWEVTRQCPLHCRHCRGAARADGYAGELNTVEGLKLLDALAEFGRPLLIITGGEPLLRPDLFTLLDYANHLGFPLALATCGHLLEEETARRLRQAGVRRISLSLDGPDARQHDEFRGVPGAYAAARTGMESARRAGLPFQMNTTVTRTNAHQLPRMLQLAQEQKAAALDLFFLVPTGRGAALAAEQVPPEECAAILQWVAETAADAVVPLRVTCAPYNARLLAEHEGRVAGKGHGQGGGGCMAGRGFLFLSHRGVVQPCGFLDVPCGEVRDAGFSLRNIYEDSPVLRSLRQPEKLRGACGGCAFRSACGGCRARAFAAGGDVLGGDPACPFSQGGQE